LAVHRGSVEARTGHSGSPIVADLSTCGPPPASCRGFEVLTAFATEMKRLYSHETVATFEVDGDVSLQTLVSVVDAMRGDACSIGEAERRGSLEGCLFFHVIVDAEPPLYFNSDRIGTLTLGDAIVERPSWQVPGGPSKRALLAAYASARAEIQRCLIDQPQLLMGLEDGDRLVVSYGRSPDDPRRSVARAQRESFRDRELERCLLGPLGADPDPRVVWADFLETTQVELFIPTRFEAAEDDPP
jgi:hypothetical protein